ncbi:MAG: LysR family transcriptional regulator [Hyphomicrobiales bacterium]|nr:LysR family transcriptional regulator [Hyphomicrobiales bacterium]MCP5370378.1 LysR family transcriptional regulator [Hyphomicrobiales bacterium]
MRRILPTFTSLQCFEAAARHLNFTRAAEELNLTQSAVSRQVRNLESFLRQDLFRRADRRLGLTEAGADYARAVAGLLDGLQAETLKVLTRDAGPQVLNLALFPTFGSFWLIPRLGGFTAAHPHLQLNLTTGTRPFDLEADDVDVAIQHGDGTWPGAVTHLIAQEETIPVCAPSLVDGRRRVPAAELARFTRLHLQSRPYAWDEWMTARGLDAPGGEAAADTGPRFEFFNMVIRAALAGLGVAVLPRMFVGEELAAGHLVAPFGPAVLSHRAYYMAYAARKADLPKVVAFRDWLLGQVAADG